MSSAPREEEAALPNDDGRAWGWVRGGTWLPLPKRPLLLAGMGPPPFDVTLPDGQKRRVVHEPSGDA